MEHEDSMAKVLTKARSAGILPGAGFRNLIEVSKTRKQEKGHWWGGKGMHRTAQEKGQGLTPNTATSSRQKLPAAPPEEHT